MEKKTTCYIYGNALRNTYKNNLVSYTSQWLYIPNHITIASKSQTSFPHKICITDWFPYYFINFLCQGYKKGQWMKAALEERRKKKTVAESMTQWRRKQK